jgi:uncharacterized protein YraI
MNAGTNFMLRRLILALALTLGAGFAPLSDAHACACCGTYRVINVADDDALNVRSGPGTHYAVVDALQPDEGCIIQTGKRSGSWVGIEASGMKGWVNRSYLKYIR